MGDVLMTSEEWLKRAEDALRPRFHKAGLIVPDDIRYAVAFPSPGARSNTIGECWSREASADKRHTIIVRADLASTFDVLAVLTHELLHASLPFGVGHGPEFKRYLKPLGLEGPATATTASYDTLLYYSDLSHYAALGKLGAVPWGKLKFGSGLVSDRPKKQGTRMLKCACPICGYTVRLTQKWLDKGAPICPTDHVAMLADETEGGD
jgi:hypothetical protein